MSDRTPATRSEAIRRFIPASPLVNHLGIELVELTADRAELVLPFDPSLATMGDIVHGGAIAALIDTAGMAATWADDERPEAFGGATVTMNVDYLASARATDLRATARVLRRGRSLCFTEVAVTGDDGRPVARGSVVQRFATPQQT